MSLDSTTLQCFLAVADTGSFTKAADKLARTQSAISQQVAKLEQLLGKILLTRGKQITLTADGEVFQSYARQIFALQNEALDHMKTPALVGEVRVGIPENFASAFLSDILAEFTRMHPRVMLNIECDLTLNLFARFKRKEFDVVLVKMNRPEDVPDGQEVWSEPLQWVGDSALIDSGKPIPLVLAPEPCVYRAAAIRALEQAGRPWRLAFSSPSYAGIITAVKAGMGVTIMPHTMIPRELSPIVPTLLPELDETHVSLLEQASPSLAMQTLYEFILKKLKH
jgi:DNA-binding transcriptional LysR family regulator